MRQIIKQPNGLYAEYSTIVDGFILTDATAEDIVENAAAEAAAHARGEARKAIARLDNPKASGAVLKWEVAVENHNRNCKEADRIQLDPDE